MYRYKFSIIIPVFNNNEGINRILEMNYLQFLKNNCEVLIIDDGSHEEIMIDNKYKNISVHRFDKNEGVAKARNFGIRNSLGEFIILLDSDDVLTSNYFSNLKKNLTARGSDALCFGAMKYNISRRSISVDSYRNYNMKAFWFYLKNYCILSGSAIRSEVAKRHLFKQTYHEDLHYWHEVSQNANVRVCPEIGVIRQVGFKGSLSGKKFFSAIGHYNFIRGKKNLCSSLVLFSIYCCFQIYYLIKSKILRFLI